MKTDKKRRYHADGTLPTDPAAIWVFGSNLAGVHGAGAALVAHRKYEAKRGIGEGITGRTYAIPTKDAHLRVRRLEEVRACVTTFLEFARSRPELDFFVTRVGCGLAGFKDSQIAPMFRGAPLNCDMPEQWRAFIDFAEVEATTR